MTSTDLGILAAKIDHLEQRMVDRWESTQAQLVAIAATQKAQGEALQLLRDAEANRRGREAAAETSTATRAVTALDTPGLRLAGWIAAWSPWQVLLAVALLVGGSTVAGQVLDRLLAIATGTTTP